MSNEERKMSNEEIDQMVSRFLGWKLPKGFAPDGGVSFSRMCGGMPREFDSPWWPVGTNLLTADQAKAMILHMLGSDAEKT